MRSYEKTFTNIKRAAKSVEDDSIIIEHLIHFPFGFIAMSVDDQPFLHSNLFYFSPLEEIIYFHTAKGGHTENLISRNNKVCFSTASMGRLLPAKESTNCTTEYLSVTVFGEVVVVHDPVVIMEVFSRYLKKYFPRLRDEDLKPFSLGDASHATLFAIHIREWSCKMNSKPDDYSGAFPYRDNIGGSYGELYHKFF